MKLRKLSWDNQQLIDLSVQEATLQKIRYSSEVYGLATYDAVKRVPIAGILGDQQAALVGQACFEPGEAKNTYGTGCFMLMNTGSQPVRSSAGLISTVAYRFGNAAAVYALEGSIAIAGALVQWLRDNLQLFASSHEIE